MALVNFKKGLQANLAAAAKEEGTFYVTTDEHAIYLDIDNSTRVRLGDFQEFENLAALQANSNPSTTALYYVKDINCLAKYTGAGYIQINPDKGAIAVEVGGAAGEANGLTATYDETSRKITISMSKAFVTANDVDGKISAAIGNLGDGYATVKAYVDAKTDGIASDEALKALDSRVEDVEDDVEELQGLVGEEAVSKQISDAIDNLELDDTYAQKTHTHTITNVTGLQDALDEKADADDLTALEDEIEETYETKEDAASKKSELDEAIAKKQDTIAFQGEYNKDTNKAATMADVTAAVAGLSGAMHFKGTVNSDPTQMSSFDSYAEGDVVVYGNKEYVFDGEKFIELGDVTAETQRIATLEGKLTGIDSTVTGYVSSEIDNAKEELIGTGSGVTATTIKGAVTEAAKYTDDAIDTVIGDAEELQDLGAVEDAIDEINEKLDGLDEAYDAAGTAAAAVKALQNGEEIKDFKGVEDALAALDSEYDEAGAADAVKEELIGKDTDTDANDTINGAKKYADAKDTALETKLVGASEGVTATTIKGGVAEAKTYADSAITTALTWGSF